MLACMSASVTRISLQLQVECVQVHIDVCLQTPASGLDELANAGRRTDQRWEDSSDEERWRCPSAGHTHGTAWLLDSASELRKVKQIAVLHVDLVNQCLELVVIQAAGEDRVNDLHHNRHDVNEVGRLGARTEPIGE